MAVLPFGSFPLGFRFCPTDVELVNHYLKKKISGRNSEVEVIPEVDVCKCEPWDLPGKSVIQSDDPEWFFFSPRDRKYPNGQRSNRATEAGYWKATGKDRMIKSRTSGLNLIGMKKTLVFYRGRAPNGERTNWVMHEYRVIDNETDIVNGGQGGFVLCRLFRKPVESGKSPNCDEVEPTGLSPSTIQSSPDNAQHARDDVHQFETELNEVTPDSDVQGGLAKMTEEQQLNIEMLLADKADDGTSCPPPPESLSNSIMASDVEDWETEMAQTEVDPLLEALEMFYEPTFSSLDPHFYSHLESEMLQVGLGQHYLDSPFYDAFENKQQTKLFQNCPAGQEASFDQSDAEFLDTILNDNHDECLSPELVSHTAAVDSSLGVKISGGYQSQYESQSHASMQAMSALKSISGIGSVSRSGTDAEITVLQMDQRPDVSEKWFPGPGLPNVESKVYLQIHAPVGTYNTEVYTDQNTEAVEHQGYDFNQPANERSWGNSSDTGTGIKITHRQKQPTANTKRPVTHGFAPKRIRLQMKFSTRPMFGMGREVLCDAENQEADTAVSEAGENVEDMKTEGSGVSGPCNSENIEYHYDDGGPHTTTKADATSDLAAIHLPDEFQKKALLLDTDTNDRIIQVPTAKRRLRTKKMGEMGTIHNGPSLKHGASKMGFSSVFLVYIALFLIISTVFWVLEWL